MPKWRRLRSNLKPSAENQKPPKKWNIYFNYINNPPIIIITTLIFPKRNSYHQPNPPPSTQTWVTGKSALLSWKEPIEERERYCDKKIRRTRNCWAKIHLTTKKTNNDKTQQASNYQVWHGQSTTTNMPDYNLSSSPQASSSPSWWSDLASFHHLFWFPQFWPCCAILCTVEFSNLYLQ